MASRAPAPLTRTRARAKYLSDSGVHPRVENVITALTRPITEIKAEQPGRPLRDDRATEDRIRVAAVFDAATAGRSNDSIAESLRYTRGEKQVREMKSGYRVIGAEHALHLDPEERAAYAAAVLQGLDKRPDDVKHAQSLLLGYLTFVALNESEWARDAAAIVVGAATSDE